MWFRRDVKCISIRVDRIILRTLMGEDIVVMNYRVNCESYIYFYRGGWLAKWGGSAKAVLLPTFASLLCVE